MLMRMIHQTHTQVTVSRGVVRWSVVLEKAGERLWVPGREGGRQRAAQSFDLTEITNLLTLSPSPCSPSPDILPSLPNLESRGHTCSLSCMHYHSHTLFL